MASALPPNCTSARRLEGKVAVITGGARGIGECTARLFSEHGAKVIIADIRDDLGESVCKDIGPSATYVHCDITSETDMQKLVDTAISTHGKLDIMFNNAGIVDANLEPSIINTDKANFEKIMSVNVIGPFLGTKHAARVMIPALKGCIITTASCASAMGGLSSHAYTSSKHAVVGLMRNTAAELGKYGIRVNCVSPHIILTDLVKDFLKLDEEGMMKFYEHFGGKVLRTEDIADAVLYLASDDSGYVSGQNVVVDGGYTTWHQSFGLF